MTEISPEAFERAALSGLIAPVLPYIDDGLRGLEETKLKSAFYEIQKGTLTPDKAFSILIEIKSYRDLARKMRQSVTTEVVNG